MIFNIERATHRPSMGIWRSKKTTHQLLEMQSGQLHTKQNPSPSINSSTYATCPLLSVVLQTLHSIQNDQPNRIIQGYIDPGKYGDNCQNEEFGGITNPPFAFGALKSYRTVEHPERDPSPQYKNMVVRKNMTRGKSKWGRLRTQAEHSTFPYHLPSMSRAQCLVQ